jgi:hypothetical protein
VDIAALLLWIVTAGAGLYVLAGRPVSSAAGPKGGPPAEAPAPASATVPASRPVQAGIPQATVDALAAGAAVPPITHTRITTPPGQHPLLEFMHPALGIVGLGCWMAYVATKFGTFAWVSSGVLLATIAAGLTWYTINTRLAAARSARSGAKPAAEDRRHPPRRVLIHGGAAATTLILALITLLIAVHG